MNFFNLFKFSTQKLPNVFKLQISTTNFIMSKNKKSKGSGSAAAGSNQPSPINNSDNAIFLNKNNEICLNIFAKPGANETGIVEILSEAISVKIGAPPVDGEANKELVKYFSKLLKLKSGDVNRDKGSKNRNKVLIVNNCAMNIDQLLTFFKNQIQE